MSAIKNQTKQTRSSTQPLVPFVLRVRQESLSTFDKYKRNVAKRLKVAAVSRPIAFEHLLNDARKAGIID